MTDSRLDTISATHRAVLDLVGRLMDQQQISAVSVMSALHSVLMHGLVATGDAKAARDYVRATADWAYARETGQPQAKLDAIEAQRRDAFVRLTRAADRTALAGAEPEGRA